jgi:APA family basic amino acid/polyamine antiporter
VSVVALRYRQPDLERPYRAPWNVRFRGRDLPLSAVVGGVGTFAAWVSVVVLHGEARIVGIPWMVLGLAGYFLYRRRAGLDPFQPARIVHPARPDDFSELSYRSALVPIFGNDVDGHALRAAAKLVGDEATVDALYVLRVPPQLSLGAGMEEEEATGRAVLDSARVRGRKSKLKVRTTLIRTRNPGAAIVEEAERLNSEVIFVSTLHAPSSEHALGPTASYLLERRPCRIVIETEPNGAARAQK